ncbi:MAG: phage integrase N-terminal SAM-like domain-containing protein [Bacteroidetes bacterium]|nr:phage integrase N-terminal SAM-like domain-containing protein [Bacteroidota bacterium]
MLNYTTITISSYILFLRLFLNYLSAHNIKIFFDKVIINYPNDRKTIKHFSYSSMEQALASIRFLYKDVLIKEILRMRV